jgi:predicted transcriptional regulator of viral defense system
MAGLLCRPDTMCAVAGFLHSGPRCGGSGDAVDVPDLSRRSQLLAAGFSDEEVRRLVRAGRLTPLRRGVYVEGPVPDDVLARHVLQIEAALGGLSDDAVVSHVSAAVLHGLRIWAVRLDRVHVTRARRNGGR